MKTFLRKSGVFATTFVIANLFLVNETFSQIAIRGGTSNVTAGSISGTNLPINKPSGVVAGDVMFANIDKYPNNTTPILSGWTLVAGPATLGGNNNSFLFYRVVDGTEGPSFTFALGTGTSYAAGSIIAFSGVDYTGGVKADGTPGGPFDADPGSISTTGATTSSLSVTPISTNTANAAVIMFGMTGGATNPPPSFNVWSTTSPGTLSEIYDIVGNTYIRTGAAWATQPIAGTSTGTSSVSLSGGSNGLGAILIAIKKLIVCPTISTTAGYNNPVCTGSTINLTASNASGGTSPYTYSWTGPNSYTSASQNPGIAGSTTAMNGTYIVTVADNTGCTGSSSIVVTINPIPVASVTGQTNITCNSANNGTITVSATGGTGTYTFSVDNGASFQTATGTDISLFTGLLPNTPYQIKVKDGNGCISK